jgi:nucleoid DNA-binding protein
MTKAQLIDRLAKAGDVTKKQAQLILSTWSTVVSSVKKGDPVKIPDLGTFKKAQNKRGRAQPADGRGGEDPGAQEVRFTVAKSFKGGAGREEVSEHARATLSRRHRIARAVIRCGGAGSWVFHLGTDQGLQ